MLEKVVAFVGGWVCVRPFGLFYWLRWVGQGAKFQLQTLGQAKQH